MALSSLMATVTSAWVAPRRQGVPRTSFRVLTVGDQVTLPAEVSGGWGRKDSRVQIWRMGDGRARTGVPQRVPGALRRTRSGDGGLTQLLRIMGN